MPVSALVFVHSPLVGPLTWRGVAAELAVAGYRTVVPDLRGDASPSAVARQVPADIERTVLIGHSGAGPMLPAIADALGTTIALIYVDAGLPRPGLSWVDDAPADLVDQLRSAVDENGQLPPWHEWFPAETLAEILPDEAMRAEFTAGVPRLPWSFFTEPDGPSRWTGPESYLLLSEAYRAEAERVRAAGPPVVELLSDHLAPLTRPTEIAAALVELLDAPLAGLVFGRHAETYEEVRPDYPAHLADEALAYAGNPDAAVEVGARTGKATAIFAARNIALTCVEPDPAMAAILRRRFPQVSVVASRFEDWTPPAGGASLIYFALSWHWGDPARRVALAHAALRPGGTLALFDHQHAFADADLEDRLLEVYQRVAPYLRAKPTLITADVIAEKTAELGGTGLFGDFHSATAVHDVAYSTDRYLDLLRTFSPHIVLAPARREALYRRIASVVDAAGGVVVVRVITTLVLARSVAP